MSAAAEQEEIVQACAKCGEKVTARSSQMFHFLYVVHPKYCTPKRKTARQAAAEKAFDDAEANGIGRPLKHQSYTGRMFLRSMEQVQSLIRIALEKQREDEPQIAAMISEGGRQ